jgi:hypothetical protein
MQLLKEIFRTKGVPKKGRIVFVRSIILNGPDVFMIHSPVNGDYKFPGGGGHPRETFVLERARAAKRPRFQP